jgi:ribosomal protein S18 acetylase RimI-like enzyme
MVNFRYALEKELPQIHQVYYENETLGVPEPPPLGPVPAELHHIYDTGSLVVAVSDGTILGYAGTIIRDHVRYLTDLFVRPTQHSVKIGQSLLQHIMPPHSTFIDCTLSSTDPRAQALYIRTGMQPQWPHYNLRLQGSLRTPLPQHNITTTIGNANGSALIEWDTQVSGRTRAADLAFLLEQQQGIPLWFQRQDTTVGYAIVRFAETTVWHSSLCHIGPVGAHTPQDAEACVLAAVQWACERSRLLRIDIPASHRSLPSLLTAGFQIVYVETFHLVSDTPFFDPRCYIVADSTLL